ncbi:MAG: MFS transporter [Gemmatimonadaceae bacterium]
MDRPRTTTAPDTERHPEQASLWTRGAVRLHDIEALVSLDGACEAVFGQLTGGAFLTGYALALGATPAAIGILAALPLTVKLSQLYTSWRVEKHGDWKGSGVRSAVAGRVVLLGAALLPFAPLSNAARMLALTLVVALSVLAGSVYELAFLTWMAELVPPAVRGAFFARRNRIMGIVGLVAGLVAAFALDRWREAHGAGAARDVRPFGVLFAIGTAFGLLGLAFLRCVPSPRRHESRATGPTLRQALAVPVRDANFRPLAGFGIAWGVGIGLVAPFFTVVMLQELGLSFLAVTLLAALATLAATISATYWGRLADHFGAKTVLRASTYLLTLVPLLWLLVSDTRLWLLVPIHLFSGLAGSAFDNTVNMLVLKVAPPAARPSYLANFGAAYASSQAAAPVVGGVVASALALHPPLHGASRLLPYYVLFFGAAAIRALATPLLARVHEHEGTSVGHLLRVMGRYRRMSSSLPLDPVFRSGYTHLARLADYIARERSAPARRAPDAPAR